MAINENGITTLGHGTIRSVPYTGLAKMAGAITGFCALGALGNEETVLGMLLLIMAAVMLPYGMITGGFEIDFPNKKYRRYRSFLGSKSGDWEAISKFRRVQVRKHVDHGGGRYGAARTKFETFEVWLRHPNGKGHHILIGEYDNHPSARDYAISMSEKLGLAFGDAIKDAQDSAVARRKRMGRR